VCQALQLKVSKIRSFALFLWSTVHVTGWGDTTKPGLWTGLWTGLDSKMDSVFRLEFQLPGVKGHVRKVGCRVCYQLKSTHCNYTDWNIKYLSIYL